MDPGRGKLEGAVSHTTEAETSRGRPLDADQGQSFVS